MRNNVNWKDDTYLDIMKISSKFSSSCEEKQRNFHFYVICVLSHWLLGVNNVRHTTSRLRTNGKIGWLSQFSRLINFTKYKKECENVTCLLHFHIHASSWVTSCFTIIDNNSSFIVYFIMLHFISNLLSSHFLMLMMYLYSHDIYAIRFVSLCSSEF